ncbi:MAG: hypothetical protein OZ921_16165 [Sorangiineae bacterium]|nr:hypothetical protein [Polyangiaceae bacterium]MEB2324048.1 hypothetical protein [Sorangiineae bacterium]
MTPQLRSSALAALIVLGLVAACTDDDGLKKRQVTDASTGDGSQSAAGSGGAAGADASAGGQAGAPSGGQGGAAGADASADLCEGVVCAAPGECHLAGTCDPRTGECAFANAPAGTPCACGACTAAGECGYGTILTDTRMPAGGTTSTPTDFAVDDERVIFANSNSGYPNGGIGMLEFAHPSQWGPLFQGFEWMSPLVTLTGGVAFFSAGPNLRSVLADGTGVASMPREFPEALTSLASDAARVYFTIGFEVFSLPAQDLNASTTTLWFDDVAQAATGGVISDGARVYFYDAARQLRSTAADGSGGTELLATADEVPDTLAVDATHLYWTEPTGGSVKSIPLAGGSVTTLASGQDRPRGLTVFDGRVYWANDGDGFPSRASVRSVPVGTSGEPPRETPGSAGASRVLAHDARCVYALNRDNNGGIRSVPKPSAP